MISLWEAPGDAQMLNMFKYNCVDINDGLVVGLIIKPFSFALVARGNSWSLFISALTAEVWNNFPDSKVHGANMGPTWALSVPDGPHVDPMNLVIRVSNPAFTDNRRWKAAGLQNRTNPHAPIF